MNAHICDCKPAVADVDPDSLRHDDGQLTPQRVIDPAGGALEPCDEANPFRQPR